MTMTRLGNDGVSPLKRRRRSTAPVARRDRPWVHSHVATLMGPVATPTLSDLRDAVVTLADLYPHSRLAWALNQTGRRWVVDGDVESLVVQRTWDDNLSPGQVLDAIAADDTLRTPLALIRYPNHLGLKVSHALGDGLIFHAIYSAVLPTAMSGVPCPWFAERAPRLPLINAACRTFGKNPALVYKAIADRPKQGAPAPSGAELPWTPSRRTVYARIPHADFDEVTSWAKQCAPGAHRVALQMSLVMRGLRASGMAVHPTVSLVVDLRRYLGARPIDGNFVASVPFSFDADTSPVDIASTIRETMASGRPLATHMLSTGRMSGPIAPESSADPRALPQLTFSTMGRLPGVDQLPFAPDGPEIYSASVEPAGPHGVTVLIVEAPQTTQITANFNDNIVDADALKAALDLVKVDPLNLLTASGGHR
jgi:hypothetical protein